MNNRIFYRGIISILTFVLFSSVVRSQVTIGSHSIPEDAALISIKDMEPTTSGGVSATTGGLLLPRVNLVKEKELLPFISTSTTPEYNDQKLKHKGLYVYNLTNNNELDEGIYYWDGEKWCLVEKGITSSEFTIEDCASDIKVNGTYLNNVSLDATNNVIVRVNVTKVGSYTITARMDTPDNGYFFSSKGVFYSTGSYDITLSGVGKPINFTPTGEAGDKFNIYTNNLATPVCSVNIKVEDSSVKPNYTMVCNSIQVKGVYKKDVSLTTSNVITLTINVSAGAEGAQYHIATDVVEGMQFRADGILGAPGPMTITLSGTGYPLTTAPKEFTISTNSATSPNSKCIAKVVPVIASKKIVAIGSNLFGLTSGGNFGCGAMIQDKMNYGDDENSIIKYEGFTTTGSAAITVVGSLGTSETVLRRYTDGANPYDIILITYNETPTVAQRAILVDYVNRGGVLIYLDQNNSGALGLRNAQVVADIFEETDPLDATSIVNIGNSCNQVIKMSTGVNDEISNGAFGDVRSGQWGEDYANSCGLAWTPRGAVVYAGATNAITGVQSTSGAVVTMLRHPSKNFFWCGDSGLIHGGNAVGGTTNEPTTPFAIGSRTFSGTTYTKFPVNRLYGSGTTKLPVCNSTIFANVMAWALNAAEMNGINSGK